MNTVNTLKYKNIGVENVTWKGNELTSLLYNDVQWIKQSTKEFTLYPILLDSGAGVAEATQFRLNFNNPLYITGNNVFLGKANDGADLSTLEYTKYDGKLKIMPVDDWGVMFSRLFEYDHWSGGVSGTSFNFTTQLSNGGTTIDMNFRTIIDENNTTLLDGCYVDKVLRIPSNGGNFTVGLSEYPYHFDEYPTKAPNLYMWDYRAELAGNLSFPVVFYENAFYTEYRCSFWSNSDIDLKEKWCDLSDTILSELSISKSGLDRTISFTVKQNNTSDYRDIVICAAGGVLIHLLQEPMVTTRIYFGVPQDEKYYFMNNQIMDNNTNDYVFPHDETYLIHTLGSRVLSKEFIVSYPENNWWLLYPANIENTFTITTEGSGSAGSRPTPNRLIWNGIVYSSINGISNNIKYKFTPK